MEQTLVDASVGAELSAAAEPCTRLGVAEKAGELWLPEEFQPEAILPVDQNEFPFRQALAQVIGEDRDADLSRLHEAEAGREMIAHFVGRAERVLARGVRANPWHRRYLACGQGDSKAWQSFLDVYHTFLQSFVLEDLRTSCVAVQAHPTFRCHMPGCGLGGRPHRDEDYNHPRGEINYWFPMTNVSGENSLYAESRRGSGDFRPFEVPLGNMVRFYANQVWHFTVPNESDSTRVSFDFRVLRREEWTPAAFLHFRLGAYYTVVTAASGVLTHSNPELRQLQEEFGWPAKPKKDTRPAAGIEGSCESMSEVCC